MYALELRSVHALFSSCVRADYERTHDLPKLLPISILTCCSQAHLCTEESLSQEEDWSCSARAHVNADMHLVPLIRCFH